MMLTTNSIWLIKQVGTTLVGVTVGLLASTFVMLCIHLWMLWSAA